MKKLAGSNWLTGLLILSMPISLVFFLGSQMAYGQVQRRYATYATLPEYTQLAELERLPGGTTVLLRGQLADPGALATGASAAPRATDPASGALLIYQERPLAGREVRYLEEFPLVFPALALTLADGTLVIEPSPAGVGAISHELHHLAVADREFTGFQAGDMVTVQGKWQPATAEQAEPRLGEVTGVAGVTKADLQADVQTALGKVRLARDGLGLLTLVSIILLISQIYRQRRRPAETASVQQTDGEQEAANQWPLPTSETVPTT